MNLKKIIAFIIGMTVCVIIWSIIAVCFNSSVIFPSIPDILSSFYNIAITKDFYINLLASMARVFMTFVISVAGASILGVLGGLIPFFNYFLMPFVSVVRTIPLLPLILIALIWFNSDLVPVFVGLLIIFPIIYESIVEAILGIDKRLIEMSLNYNVGIKDRITGLYLPSIIPYFFTAISQSMGTTWKSVLAAEILSLPTLGIGGKLYEMHLYLDTASLFAYCLIAIFINGTFEILIKIRGHYVG